MNDSRIALIGFMGSGKSSAGRIIARSKAFPFIDLDELIESEQGRSIADIFEQEGEAAFRKIEAEALRIIAFTRGNLVLACGGGIVLSRDNLENLKTNFLNVWIDVPIEDLLRRLRKAPTGRPLLYGSDWEDRTRKLYEERKTLYESAAHIRVEWKTGESVSETAEKIIKSLSDRSRAD
jgi:shikimate kinase